MAEMMYLRPSFQPLRRIVLVPSAAVLHRRITNVRCQLSNAAIEAFSATDVRQWDAGA